jgi:hypothetical protein
MDLAPVSHRALDALQDGPPTFALREHDATRGIFIGDDLRLRQSFECSVASDLTALNLNGEFLFAGADPDVSERERRSDGLEIHGLRCVSVWPGYAWRMSFC